MKILVTGGCGYKGHVLVPRLLTDGHQVTVMDTMWFGNFLRPHPKLEVKRFDIRHVDLENLEQFDAIIHLASIANDPCGELDPVLTWETSCLATMKLADAAARVGVSRFIYASSGSVYGIKDEENVTEELTTEPLSEYNKTKMVSERVILSYSKQMNIQIVRPATVCGLSPRMRLDVSVNLLTMQALRNQIITVFGGEQIRPNVHIEDVCDAYLFLLNNPSVSGIFNVGFENKSILEIAKIIQGRIECEIVVQETNDPRSYRLDSSKILSHGFKPKKTINDAIKEIELQYRQGKLKDHECNYNLAWMNKTVMPVLSL